MNKFILISISTVIALLIGIAALGIAHNRNIKWQHMPDGICYEVNIGGNVWPDRCYTNTYERIDATTIFFPEGYWVFEPSKKPFGRPTWVFHQTEVMNVAEYSIVYITFVASE